MSEIMAHDMVNDVSDQLDIDKCEAEQVLEGMVYDYVEEDDKLDSSTSK